MKGLILSLVLSAQLMAAPAPQAPKLAPPSLPSTLKTAPVGRFAAFNFGTVVGDTFNNFLWVVDTETGAVAAYRVSRIEEKGVFQAWVTQKLMTSAEYSANLWMAVPPTP